MQLIRQGFVERYRVGETKGAGKKRARAPAATQGEDNEGIEWRWGPRSLSEIGETGIAKFIADFMVQREEDAEDEGNANQEQKAKQRLEKMMQGIGKAAGSGKLLDITGK